MTVGELIMHLTYEKISGDFVRNNLLENIGGVNYKHPTVEIDDKFLMIGG